MNIAQAQQGNSTHKASARKVRASIMHCTFFWYGDTTCCCCCLLAEYWQPARTCALMVCKLYISELAHSRRSVSNHKTRTISMVIPVTEVRPAVCARCRSDCAADSDSPGVRNSCATLLDASSFSNEEPCIWREVFHRCDGHVPHKREQPYCSVRIDTKSVVQLTHDLAHRSARNKYRAA